MADSPDTIVRRWFEEVWEEGREESIDALFAPSRLPTGYQEGLFKGPTAFKPLFRMFRDALGDLSIEVVRTVTQGDVVAAYCHVTGRHVGAAFGGAPTGQPVDFWGMTIARVEEGKIVEGWNSFDMLGMYQQTGWVANPPLPPQPLEAAPPV